MNRPKAAVQRRKKNESSFNSSASSTGNGEEGLAMNPVAPSEPDPNPTLGRHMTLKENRKEILADIAGG